MSKHITILGFAFILSAILSAMKFADLVDWSWWFCGGPLLITMGVYILLTMIGLIAMYFAKPTHPYNEDSKD